MAEGIAIEALSGEEIIQDVLRHVENALRNDCNLRGADAYAGGFSGVIDIKLNLHDMDVLKSEVKAVIGKSVDDPDAAVIEKTVDVALEPNLETVRERILTGPDLSSIAEPVPDQAVVSKRRQYLRRAAAVGNMEVAASGGAVDVE